MSDTTKIEWCDHSWSPWEGCTKVSPGCLNCYAEARDKRHLFGPESHWGKGAPRRLTKDWRKPVKWNQTDFVCRDCGAWDHGPSGDCVCGQYGATGKIRHTRVFPSVCDWLDAEVPVEWLARFLQLIHDTPNLDWLLLTKRPENFEERTLAACQLWSESITASTAPMVRWLMDWRRGFEAPRNVWVGTSVEDQTRANQRVPALLKIPARVRFLSVEPLLGPVDLIWTGALGCDCPPAYREDGEIDIRCTGGCSFYANAVDKSKVIDWIIVGGESGRNARVCNVDWIRSIVTQCADAGAPCFVKQLGARPVTSNANLYDFPESVELREPWDDLKGSNADGFAAARIALNHPKGGDPLEWPEQLRVRQFPEVNL